MADIPVILITDEARDECSDDDVDAIADRRQGRIDNCTDVEDLDMAADNGTTIATAKKKCQKSKSARRQAKKAKARAAAADSPTVPPSLPSATPQQRPLPKTSTSFMTAPKTRNTDDCVTDCENLDTSDEDGRVRSASAINRRIAAVASTSASSYGNEQDYPSATSTPQVSDESDYEAGFKIHYINESDVSETEIEYDFETKRLVRRGKTGRHPQTTLVEMLVPAGDDDDAPTDVDKDNSNDEDEEEVEDDAGNAATGGGTKKMATLSLYSDKGLTAMSALTDVEDFGDGVDEIQSPTGYYPPDIRMPSPMREMTVVRENATGSPVARVMPMQADRFLRLDDVYMDNAGHTDVEDMSGAEDDYADDADGADCIRGISHIIDLDGGIVSNIESMRPFVKSVMQEKLAHCESVSDADEEEAASAITVCGGGVGGSKGPSLTANSCGLRRRKSKSKRDMAHTQHQQHQHQPHGHTRSARAGSSSQYGDADVPLLTDCEDLEVEENAPMPGYNLFVKKPTPKPTTKQPISISCSLAAPPSRYDAKTDTECLSGDDDDGDNPVFKTVDTAVMCNESFSSTTTSREMNNQMFFRNVPVADRLQATATPDQMLTDVEVHSDVDEFGRGQLGSRGCDVNRKVSITPVEIQWAMGDGSEVVDRNVSYFDRSQEGEHLKDQRALHEAVTDSEYLRSEGEGAEEAEEVAEE